MQKIYLLLRNNQQSGPYSLDELIRLGIKPDDLLWIEGKSVGWFYPSEIEELKQYSNSNHSAASKNTAAPTTSRQTNTTSGDGGKKIFVSMPANFEVPPVKKEKTTEDNIEQKAEALRKRVQNYTAAPDNSFATDMPQPYNPYAYPKEPEKVTPLYSKKAKAKKPSAKSGAIAILLIMLLTVGIIIWQQAPDWRADAPVEAIPQQALSTEEPLLVTDDSGIVALGADHSIAANEPEQLVHPAHYSTTSTPEQIPAAASKPINNKQDKHPETTIKQTQNDIPATNTPVNNTPETATNQQEENTAAAPEKKKTLGERIDNFFDRFKRKKEAGTAAESTDETTAGTAERKAIHRDDPSSTDVEKTTDLTSQVTISASEPADNWMMGIRGLKITLRNRSNQMVKTAQVEVRYYSEQNQLLQKKIINFNNIPPQKSATLPAPDHTLADHTDYTLLSVKGE